MGATNSTSRGRHVGGPAAPKTFYLVIGGPPITHRIPGKGPLIYQVDLPQDRGPQQVETAQTVRNLYNVTHKNGISLSQCSRADAKQGFQLSFQLDGPAEDVYCTIDIFLGVKLELVKGQGLVLSPARGPEQGQYGIYHQENIRVDGRGRKFRCDVPILLHELQKLSIPERFNAAQQTSAEGAAAYAPIIIQLTYIVPAEYEEEDDDPTGPLESPTSERRSSPSLLSLRERKEVCPKRQQVLSVALKVDPTQAENLPEEQQVLHVHGTRTFLQFDQEVYEVNDVFDAGEGAVVGPKEVPNNSSIARGAEERNEKEGTPAGAGNDGEPGSSPPPQTESTGGSPSFVPDDDETNACVVCLTNPKDTTVMPCRHLCLCSECAAIVKHQNNRCPVCRTPIDRLMAFRAPRR